MEKANTILKNMNKSFNNRTSVRVEELVAYIQAQPNDREVKMGSANNNSTCGCVMVQYAREYDDFPAYNFCNLSPLGWEKSATRKNSAGQWDTIYEYPVKIEGIEDYMEDGDDDLWWSVVFKGIKPSVIFDVNTYGELKRLLNPKVPALYFDEKR